ncbi:hypothetical protein VC83_05559 [Pseudogymnoascus destructans]|uniref:DNA repair protein rad5 n=2 Tax=Pseudogymnoascus destructans TaxID=655981 RepID=L8G8L7_PSED2|nr:uncharacterized protein VC83_05559 [Pseudogymnoascus destructans]ELR09194.1 hypothetical protein GMDG_03771 [Pseudogymnoascus destructans 20631-21]OAF57668.1 hypothetical protein VC83_05559 [Pseudogymnoascus destructans]
MDPTGTGRRTPPTTQPGQGLPSGKDIQDARPRGGLFVTPDPDDEISVQSRTGEPINHPQAPNPHLIGHDPNQRIRVAQEAMKREILLKRKSGRESIFDGSGRVKIQRSNPSTGSLHEEIPFGENADHNMDNHNEEDHSWMDTDNDGSSTDEREALLRNMNALEEAREKNNGELTPSQQLEYLQASQRLHTASWRLQKGKSSSGLNIGTDDMYVDPMSEDDDAGIYPEMAEGIPNFTSQSEPSLVTAKGQKKPSRKNTVNRTAREVHSSKQAAKAKAVGNKGRVPKKGKKQPGTVPTGVHKTTYKSRMRNKWPEVDDTVQKLLASLIQSDTIKERMEQDDVEEGPDIITNNKASQLRELLSSIPRDYDANRAKNEKNTLNEASKSFGHGRVKAKNGKWLLVGMKTPLYHHQLLAADWMVKRELSLDRPHGGLLADAMGLGKTVSTLATMVGNPPAEKDIAAMRKATLIVVPASLLSQWEAEIKVHVDEKIFQKVMPYKSSSRISTNILSDCDIVLTSFTEVANSWPFPSSVEDKADARLLGEDEWANNRNSLKGDLQRVKWYRIVLDEAQAIKNYRSRTSIACHKLDSTYRWTLSGTPVLNSLNELYPYFRFLRLNWASSFPVFKKNFGDPDANDSTKRLNVMLSVIMMRRTIGSTILGRPLVQLPPIHPSLQTLTLSGVERAIYRTLEDRFRGMMNNHFKAGTTEKNYGLYLTQLLRLRQAASHPFLLERCIKDLFDAEDLLGLKLRLKRLKKDKRPIYEQIELWTSKPATNNEPKQSGDSVSFGRSDFGNRFDFEGFLSEADHEKIYARIVCILCSDLPQDPVKTDCGHIFCRACLEGNIHAQAATLEFDYTACPKCEKIFEHYEPWRNPDLKGSDDGAGSERSDHSSGQPTRQTSRRKDANYKPHIKDSEWLKTCIETPKKLLPSTKTIALKAQILRWVHEAPDDKILIFTQFRMMTRIVGLLCEKECWGHVYFTGDMNMRQRTHAVEQFHTNKNIKIMIAVLKCGGVGLNLKCANRCITIDPWWNHSVEQQAFGRIFRIGQMKETHVARFVVKNTVDMRILDMQKEKMAEIDGVMIEAGKPLAPLSIEEMASLFGHLVKGDDGITQVVADYESEAESDGDYEDEGQVAEESAE